MSDKLTTKKYDPEVLAFYFSLGVMLLSFIMFLLFLGFTVHANIKAKENKNTMTEFEREAKIRFYKYLLEDENFRNALREHQKD